VRAGAAGLRQTRASFRPAADAVLPRCRPHFLGEGGQRPPLPSRASARHQREWWGDVRAGAAGVRQTWASFRPMADAVLPRCRPHFLEGRAAPSPHPARLRESGANLVPGEEMHPAYVSGLAASPVQAWPRRSTASAALRTVSSA